MTGELSYNNKPIDIKLTFNARFKLISLGLSIASGLITDGSSIVDFCRFWSLLLKEPFNDTAKDIETETEKFLKGFNMLEAVNPYLIMVLKRDGFYNEEEQPKTKKKAIQNK